MKTPDYEKIRELLRKVIRGATEAKEPRIDELDEDGLEEWWVRFSQERNEIAGHIASIDAQIAQAKADAFSFGEPVNHEWFRHASLALLHRHDALRNINHRISQIEHRRGRIRRGARPSTGLNEHFMQAARFVLDRETYFSCLCMAERLAAGIGDGVAAPDCPGLANHEATETLDGSPQKED